MSAPLVFAGAGYRYPGASAPAIDGVDLVVEAGQLVLLTGPTGCGKSTLVRLAAGLLGRHGGGEIHGRVEVQGEEPSVLGPAARARRIGFVSQTPDRQILTSRLGDEIAFPLESIGADPVRLDQSVEEQLTAFDLPGPSRSPEALSGGQRQRLVTASAMAGGAGLLLLDEPLSQLDPAGADALMGRLRALADGGTAILVVEHRLGPTLPRADRVVVMSEGRLTWTGAPSELRDEVLEPLGMQRPRALAPPQKAGVSGGPVLLEAGPLKHRYRDASVDALEVLGLTLRAGERVALLGANGSGKSTLLAALSGEIAAGDVQVEGRLLDLPQDPDLTLFSATVREEIAHGPMEQRLPRAEVGARVRRAAEALSVTDLMDRPPHALSRGQRLRVAVASMLSCEPSVVLLDEPTSGQDYGHVERMMAELRSPDRALLFATHDEDLARRHATRILRLRAGRFIEQDASSATVTPALTLTDETSGGLDPRVRIALLLCVGVLAVALGQAGSLAALAAASALPLLFIGLPRRWLFRGGLALIALVWSTVLSQGLFYAELPRVPWIRLGPIVLWTEGVLWGLVQSLRFMATLLAGIALVVSTSPDRLYAAMLRLRVPFGLAFLASMALRAVPDTARSAFIVRRARARRGRSVLARSPWAWLSLEVALLRPVVAEALRRARSLAEALDTRGFDPTAPRSARRPLRARRWELGLLAIVGGLTGTAVIGRLLFVLYVTEVLYVPAWRPLYGWVRAWL